MSYQGTLNLVEKLSEDHDIEAQFWRDEINDAFLKMENTVSYLT